MTNIRYDTWSIMKMFKFCMWRKSNLSYIMKVLKIERTKVVAIVETNNKKGNFPLLGTKYKAKKFNT